MRSKEQFIMDHERIGEDFADAFDGDAKKNPRLFRAEGLCQSIRSDRRIVG